MTATMLLYDSPDCPNPKQAWHTEDKIITPPLGLQSPVYKPEILETIESAIDSLSADLRKISLDISDHPEVKFEEHHAHDVLTAFMEEQGFNVTRHYLLPTAWKATFSNGNGVGAGRNFGINSEMDALPGIGHACGHNLIAIAGLAVACGLKAAIVKWNINGTITLLGTPAEEAIGGKIMLLDKGGYEGMDACVMCHPAPGPQRSVSLSSSLAVDQLQVDYKGHSAHAALSPWEGVNALDAAVLSYNNISALRQQIKPTYRVQGIFKGNDWAPNIIPDNAQMNWLARAPTRAEMEPLSKRVQACFDAAALATGCEVDIKRITAYYDLRQNTALGKEVSSIVEARYGTIDYEWGIKSASTDFGNVGYVIPSLHPSFAIPTEKNGGNHTPAFTKAARSTEAHNAALDLSKALAATGARVLLDDDFFSEVKKAFEEDRKQREEGAAH